MAIFLSVYGGYAIYFFYEIIKNKYKWILTLLLISFSTYGFYNTFTININFLNDVRYKAERWIENNIPQN